MAQNSNVELPELTYDRSDYTALRAHCLKIPLQRIADLYYSEDSPQVEQGLERWLLDMRANLIERAIEHNPLMAETLQGARQGGAITTKALGILIEAAEMPKPIPCRSHKVSQWFRPKTASAFKAEGMLALGDLVDVINRRGPNWWRSVPRIGAGRAEAVLRFLRRWPERFGDVGADETHGAPFDNSDLLPLLDPMRKRELAPLGTFQLPVWLSGTDGVNRSPAFCFISARNDLEAINSFLNRYKGQGHTERAYRKELERFILWCALVACKPMSSLLVDDCEAYKNFLRAPLPEFCGARTVKTSKRWRPFADEMMSASSQKQAILVLRGAFDWLVKVRYLGGNPWVAVKDPSVIKQADEMQIDRALTRSAWDTFVDVLSDRASRLENYQDRVALSAILLMGDSGLRRAEVASARRDNIKPSRHADGVWMLAVLGKRSKVRKVPVSQRTIEALRAHWRDRALDFDDKPGDLPLLSPIIVPGTDSAKARHAAGNTHGYHDNSLYSLVAGALCRVRDHAAAASETNVPLFTLEDLVQLENTSPHAFRHTFGTLAVEDEMPIVVAQDILGHASASTTSIYVKAKEKRIAEAAEQYYAGLQGRNIKPPKKT